MSGESKPVIQAEAYRAPTGQWAWKITEDGIAVCGAGGYASEDEARIEMLDHFSGFAEDRLAEEALR